MDTKCEKECRELIEKYRKYKAEHYKIKARNDLYMKMNDDLLIWIKSVLKEWGKFETEDEILSVSWDVFEFGLKYYVIGYSVPEHFYTHTKYFLLNKYAKKENVFLPLEDLENLLNMYPNPTSNAFVKVLDLYRFLDFIPDGHKVVVEDAMHSMDSSFKQHSRKSEIGGMSTESYYRLKKAYIAIIKFITK